MRWHFIPATALLPAAAILALLAWMPGSAAADPGVERELRELTDRLAVTPADPRLLLARAELSGRLGRFDDAQADLDLAEVSGGDRGRVDLLRAVTFADAGRFEQAVRLLEGSVTLMAPRDRASAYALLATLHERFDRIDDAVLAYDRALELRPDVQLHLSRGRLLRGVGRVTEAIAGLEEGVIALAGAAVLRAQLIEIYLAAGMPRGAIGHAGVLITSARAKSRWLLLRGQAYDLAGDPRRARIDREAALADAERVLSRRGSATARLARARALSALGRDAEARADLERVVRRAPRNREARALLHALRQGGAR
ncbi:MAG: hypothetical protein DRJ42_02625 [Deltaproteobacteria bacterium]|nr:MAG: hypothetical protein DRJ42_02625 [Deltaproteobacteria bacterium]